MRHRMFITLKRLFLLHFGTLKQLENSIEFFNKNFTIENKRERAKKKAIKKIESALPKVWKKLIKRSLKYKWRIDGDFSLDILNVLTEYELQLFKDKEEFFCCNGKYKVIFYLYEENIYEDFARVIVIKK
jgi:hypothetical protein